MHHFQCVIIVLIRESKYEQEFYCQAPQSDMMHKLPNSDSDGVAATLTALNDENNWCMSATLVLGEQTTTPTGFLGHCAL